MATLGGCLSCSTGTSTPSGSGNPDSGGAGGSVVNLGGGGGLNVGGESAVGPLVITPLDPVMDVTVENGMVTSTTLVGGAATPLTFSATAGGAPVMPAWSIERGELGSMDAASGVFVPSGKFSGVGTISAVYGQAVASTTVTINLHVVQNGGAWDPATVMDGPGGIGGVGGEQPGGPVDDPTKMRLTGAAQTPATAQEFGLIYPYDGTVFPRAILAPLVQWQTSHAASAVYIHLTQENFEFQGFYSGTSLIREHIDQ
ncbi:MAG TPA: hypothetical protein VGP93_21195, partial [Polyangiaceae bacterium]|nr:hypothetical protein [Polyangiaceae bacterium]